MRDLSQAYGYGVYQQVFAKQGLQSSVKGKETIVTVGREAKKKPMEALRRYSFCTSSHPRRNLKWGGTEWGEKIEKERQKGKDFGHRFRVRIPGGPAR